MKRPTLVTSHITDEQYANVTYHIQGELAPTLTVELTAQTSVYFEHHTMLWKNTSINISLQKIKGALKRMLAGMRVFMTAASGQGEISFSRNGPGQIIPIHLQPGQEIDVREHQFLAATSDVSYSFSRVKGMANMMFGGTGFFIDKFTAAHNNGIVWLHGHGNVLEKVLAAGEQIDVECGAWLYKDPSVCLETKTQRLGTGLMAGGTLLCNRFTGPGRVAIQSISQTVLKARGLSNSSGVGND